MKAAGFSATLKGIGRAVKDRRGGLPAVGVRAECVRVSAPRKNALDFHIALHLVQLALREPEACFHIISRDSGFDP